MTSPNACESESVTWQGRHDMRCLQWPTGKSECKPVPYKQSQFDQRKRMVGQYSQSIQVAPETASRAPELKINNAFLCASLGSLHASFDHNYCIEQQPSPFWIVQKCFIVTFMRLHGDIMSHTIRMHLKATVPNQSYFFTGMGSPFLLTLYARKNAHVPT